MYDADKLSIMSFGADVDEAGNIKNATVMPTVVVMRPKDMFVINITKSAIDFAQFRLMPSSKPAPLPGLGGAPYQQAAKEIGALNLSLPAAPILLSDAIKAKQGDEIINRFLSATFLFHVLGRDPTVLVQKIERRDATLNHKRARQNSQPSNVHSISIDPVAYSRIVTRRAQEIQSAMQTRGGYKIDGLVLVSGYVTKAGTAVEPHARCPSDPGVRKHVTWLLQQNPVDYALIGDCVEAWGARGTKAAIANPSPLNNVKIAEPVRNNPPQGAPKGSAPDNKIA